MDLGAGPEVLLGVGEEVVRTCADEIGATDFWISNGELSVSRGGTGTHKLLCEGMISGSYTKWSMMHVFGARLPTNLPSSFLCSAAMT